jgi:hypothetical protein
MVLAPVLPEARMPPDTIVAAALELPFIFRMVFPVAERLGKALWIPYMAYAPTWLLLMAPPPVLGPPIVLLLIVADTPVVVFTRIPLKPVVVPVPELKNIAPMLLLEISVLKKLKL